MKNNVRNTAIYPPYCYVQLAGHVTMFLNGRVAWLAKRTSAQDTKASTAKKKLTIKLINKMAMLLPDKIIIITELTNYQLETDVDRFKRIQEIPCRTAIPSWIIKFSLECPLSSLMLYLTSCVISFVPSDIWFRSATNRARKSYLLFFINTNDRWVGPFCGGIYNNKINN